MLLILSLVYLQRCSSTGRDISGVKLFDDILRASIEKITNTHFDDAAWMQASLPVVKGGLGIRHATDLALPAFLASVSGVSGFAQSILPQELLPLYDPAENEAVQLWLAKPMSVLPEGEKKDPQKEWESP